LRCSPSRVSRLRLGSVAAALVDSPQQLNLGYVYKQIEKLDTDKRAQGWLPLMASSSGGQIGALCAESFCEHIFAEANDMCHDGNALLDTEEINMLVVLRMNREFIQHMCRERLFLLHNRTDLRCRITLSETPYGVRCRHQAFRII